MKVSELQQFLSQLVGFVRAAGAAEKVAEELGRAAQSLEPFKHKTLAEFNDFLKKAEEFDRTGVLAAPKKPARAPKAAKLSVKEAAQKFSSLCDRATDPTLDYATIDTEIDALAGLTAANLKEVARQAHITLPARATKPQILDELKRRIKERKGSFERTQFRADATAP
jgi:hypothetical protein